jgi:hypothetical protein
LVNKKEVKKKVSKKAAPAAGVEPTLEKVENSITSKVVQMLAPEMNKSIEAKFEEMKTIFTNELKDIRSHMEAAPAIDPAVSDPPTMPVNDAGLTQPQAQEKAGLDSLLPIMQMLGITGGQQNQGGLNNMFMEAIMRKSLADITRGDMMNEMMSKAMYKKLSGGDDMPDGITETTDSLMNPLRKYGEKANNSNK